MDLTLINTDSFHKRFAAKVSPPNTDGCILWIGTLNSAGYGVIGLGGRGTGNIRAHRAAYIMGKGPIPDELVIDHLCRVRSCVNPDHLEAVTSRLNVQRGSTILHEVCKNGHPRTEENTYVDPRGFQECKLCRRDAVRRYRGGDV